MADNETSAEIIRLRAQVEFLKAALVDAPDMRPWRLLSELGAAPATEGPAQEQTNAP